MPGMDGLETSVAIRQLDNELAVQPYIIAAHGPCDAGRPGTMPGRRNGRLYCQTTSCETIVGSSWMPSPQARELVWNRGPIGREEPQGRFRSLWCPGTSRRRPRATNGTNDFLSERHTILVRDIEDGFGESRRETTADVGAWATRSIVRISMNSTRWRSQTELEEMGRKESFDSVRANRECVGAAWEACVRRNSGLHS